jgi:hypothetical protein
MTGKFRPVTADTAGKTWPVITDTAGKSQPITTNTARKYLQVSEWVPQHLLYTRKKWQVGRVSG